MKQLTVAVLIIVAFILYSFIYNHSGPVALLPNNSTDSSPSSSSSTRASSTSVVPTASGATGTPDATSTSKSLYKDGAYTGRVADAQLGYIQVQAIIQR